MRAALYIRVSTVAQAVEGYSLDAQRHTLEASVPLMIMTLPPCILTVVSVEKTLTTDLMQLKCFVMSRITSLI